MPLVEKIAKKIFLINKGEELYHGTLAGIYDVFARKHIINIRLNSSAAIKTVTDFNEVESISILDEFNIQLTLKQDAKLNNALSELAKIEDINDITSYKPDLHDIFLQLVKNHNQ
jgi:ABC-2 type transport system ATP-binding protein